MGPPSPAEGKIKSPFPLRTPFQSQSSGGRPHLNHSRRCTGQVIRSLTPCKSELCTDHTCIRLDYPFADTGVAMPHQNALAMSLQ